jgi:hypothetical protein
MITFVSINSDTEKIVNWSCSLHCGVCVGMPIGAEMCVDERKLACVNGDNCVFLEGFFVLARRV